MAEPWYPMEIFSSTPALVNASTADKWRDDKIAELVRENDSLKKRSPDTAVHLFVFPRLLRQIRREATRRSRNLRARIGREVARNQKIPDVELRGGKFVVGRLKRVPSGAILDYADEE